MTLAERLKQEFVSGWKPFEVVWLALFIIAQIWLMYKRQILGQQ